MIDILEKLVVAIELQNEGAKPYYGSDKVELQLELVKALIAAEKAK